MDAAGSLGLALGRVDDGHVLGTTALGVLDIGTGGAARVTVLAGRAVGHAIVKLEVAVELGHDVDSVKGELIYAGAAAERGRLGLVGGADTADEVAAGAGSISLARVLTAGPVVEVEILVGSEGARGQVPEGIAAGLVRGAVVGRVAGARERRSVAEASGSSASHQGEERNSVHDCCFLKI